MVNAVGQGVLLSALVFVSACGGSSSNNAVGGASGADSSGGFGNGGASSAAGASGVGDTAGSSSSACAKTMCSVSSPTATLTGTTPNGPLSLSYAWKEQVNGFSTSTSLLFTNASTAPQPQYAPRVVHSQCDNPSVSIQLGSEVGVGMQNELVFVLYQDGSEVDVPAVVTIDSDDKLGNTSGTVDIRRPGWNVHGTFQAPDCPELDLVDK